MPQFVHLPDESFRGSIGLRGFGGELNKAVSTEQALALGKCLGDVSFPYFLLSTRLLLSILSLMTPGGIEKPGSFPYMHALCFKQQIKWKQKGRLIVNGVFSTETSVPPTLTCPLPLCTCPEEDQRHAAHWLGCRLVAFDNSSTGTCTLKLSFYSCCAFFFFSLQSAERLASPQLCGMEVPS